MGLFIRQDENRTELQERLAAELREKAKLKASGGELLDETKNSRYLKDTQEVGKFGWIWPVVVLVFFAGFIIYMFSRQ